MTGGTNARSNTIKYANTKQFTGKYWIDGRKIYSMYFEGSATRANNGWMVPSWADISTLNIDKIIFSTQWGKDSVATYPKITSFFTCAITTQGKLAIYSSPMVCDIDAVLIEYVENV